MRPTSAMKKSTVHAVVLVAASTCVTMLILELGLRIVKSRVGRMEYHSRLGWVPKPGRFGSEASWLSNVDASGLRSNGTPLLSTSPPILAVGDSFTFGDEIGDSETWSAHLETKLNRHVLNGGVSGYGLDQAVLRAEALLDVHRPDVVILSFISDNVTRSELSYYRYGRGWKPYFELVNGSLNLRNVPVPKAPAPAVSAFRRILSHSVLVDAVLSRTVADWWQRPSIEHIHNDGESVSVELLARLNDLTRTKGAQFLVVSFATNGRIGGNAKLPNVIRRTRERGIQVLDLASETLRLPPEEAKKRFVAGGHYTSEMNRWVADQIAAYLHRHSARISPQFDDTVGQRKLIRFHMAGPDEGGRIKLDSGFEEFQIQHRVGFSNARGIRGIDCARGVEKYACAQRSNSRPKQIRDVGVERLGQLGAKLRECLYCVRGIRVPDLRESKSCFKRMSDHNRFGM